MFGKKGELGGVDWWYQVRGGGWKGAAGWFRARGGVVYGGKRQVCFGVWREKDRVNRCSCGA